MNPSKKVRATASYSNSPSVKQPVQPSKDTSAKDQMFSIIRRHFGVSAILNLYFNQNPLNHV